MGRAHVTLKSEALAAARAATAAGLRQTDIAGALGASQSQVSRILSGRSLRRSRLFDEVCIYAFDALRERDAISKPAAASNAVLTAALDAVWDGSERHAQALALIIRSLAALGASHARKETPP